MTPNSAEPVCRIAIVRLAPMHNAMNVSAISVFDTLRLRMGRIEMIVPEQDERTDQLFGRRGELSLFKYLSESFVQTSFWQHTRTRARTERRKFGCVEQFNKTWHGTN